MNKVQQFIKAYDVTDKHAARVLGVSPCRLSDWKNERRSLPSYIENSIALHLDLPQAHQNRLKELYK